MKSYYLKKFIWMMFMTLAIIARSSSEKRDVFSSKKMCGVGKEAKETGNLFFQRKQHFQEASEIARILLEAGFHHNTTVLEGHR